MPPASLLSAQLNNHYSQSHQAPGPSRLPRPPPPRPRQSQLPSVLHSAEPMWTVCVCCIGGLTSIHTHTHRLSIFSFSLCTQKPATSSAHLEDLAYLDEQRHTPLRTSLRMPRQSTTCGPGRSGQDLRGWYNTHTRTHAHTSFQVKTLIREFAVLCFPSSPFLIPFLIGVFLEFHFLSFLLFKFLSS